MEYVDKGANYYKEQYRKKIIGGLRRQAESLGYTLQEKVPALAETEVS